MRRKKSSNLPLVVLLLAGIGITAGGAGWLLLEKQRDAKTQSTSSTDPEQIEDGEQIEEEPAAQQATDAERRVAQRAVSTRGILVMYIDRFRVGMRRYPANVNELLEIPADLAPGENWDGPYVHNPNILTDPWGQTYRIATPGKHNTASYDLYSIGFDGRDDTYDDIGNW